MQRKLFILLFAMVLVPSLLFAATGKIHGKVTDAGTGEALVGANIVIVGTSMGAATDVNGEFTILNVVVGTYQLRCSYVGYQSITVSNVRVNADLTTEQTFKLPAEGVTVATVEITAERPLINKSATNAVRIIDQEFFAKIPARGLNAVLGLQPGIVSQGGSLYIRGSRPDEVGYEVEGVAVSNALYGGIALSVTDLSVEQTQVQAGGYNAEYGNANAGIVSTQLRTGSPEAWKGSLLVESDNFTSQQKKALGGYSYGYSDVTAAIGGPILSKTLRFFGSIENTFMRDPSVSVRSPYSFSGLVTNPTKSIYHPADGTISDTLNINFGGGNAIGGMDNRWITSGTMLLDLGALQVRGAGSYSWDQSRNQTVYASMFDIDRLGLNKNKDGFGSMRFSYVPTPTTFAELSLSYYSNSAESMDPVFQRDLFSYGDSAANAARGYQLMATGSNFPAWQLFGGAFSVNQPGAVLSGYAKTLQTSMGAKLDVTSQQGQHEIKFGGEYTRYKIRRYAPAGVLGWAAQKQLYDEGLITYSELIDAIRKVGGTGSDIYGYDPLGNTIEDDVVQDGAIVDMAPRKPTFAAAYVQDKIELTDIILNLGLRFDYINPDSWDAPDPGALQFNAEDYILQSSLTKTAATKQISPRIGFSFPVTDRTQFHAQFGKFIQQSKLRDSYLGMANLAGIVKGGFFTTAPAGWGLKPERTTQYEIGFAQQISDASSFDITAFYKDIMNQIQYTYILPAAGSTNANYPSLINGDFSTSKGVEVKLTLRRTNRVTAQVNYTFSDARTTGSNPASVAGIWSAGSTVDYPKYVYPADFNQAHRGSILLDYRFAKGDGGPVLEQLGLNLLLQFNSGHNFTLLQMQQQGPAPTDPRFRTPVEPIGSSTTPWFFQLDARLDKTVRIGPMDANFYVYVLNLLGTDNAVNAFLRTGDPRDDGWFSSSQGHTDALSKGAQYVAFYDAVQLGENSGNFGPPRQIRFGVRLDY